MTNHAARYRRGSVSHLMFCREVVSNTLRAHIFFGKNRLPFAEHAHDSTSCRIMMESALMASDDVHYF